MTPDRTIPDRATVSTFLCPGCDGPLVPVPGRGPGPRPGTGEQYRCPHGCGTYEYVYATKRLHEVVTTAPR